MWIVSNVTAFVDVFVSSFTVRNDWNDFVVFPVNETPPRFLAG